jgi:hypothetical protein
MDDFSKIESGATIHVNFFGGLYILIILHELYHAYRRVFDGVGNGVSL